MGAKIKIYATSHDNVRIKINFGDKNVRIPRGFKSSMRELKTGEYDYTLDNYNQLEGILSANQIDTSKVPIDEDSIDTFYCFFESFGPHYSANLSEEFIDEWWNYDCPDLFRYKTNKGRYKNGWGLNLICWEHKLLEPHFSSVYFGDPTEKELRKLIRGRENTVIGKESKEYIRSQKISEEELEKAKEIVRDYEKKIQIMIDRHKDEIIDKFDGELYDVTEDGIKPKNFGLDLGFVNIYSNNPTYKKNKRMLSNFGGYKWMDIKLPYSPQSTTIKKEIAKECIKIIKEKLGENLYCESRLD